MNNSSNFGTPLRRLNNSAVPTVRLHDVALGSPLRRSVLRKSVAPQVVIDQDDESERLKRRSAADIERRLTNVVAPDLTPRREQEIHQHFQLCLKLFVENVVLESQKQVRDCLQLGSTSLDVSAKIYGLRVDDVHSDALKLTHNMARVSNAENEEPVEADDGEKRTSKKRKKKALSLQNKNTIIKDIKSITGDIPKLLNNSFQTRTGVDFNSISDLRTNTMLMHPYGHHFMNLNNNPAWTTYENVDEEFKKETEKPRPWPLVIGNKKLKLCVPFSDFEIDNWDPEQDSHLMDSSNSSYNNVVVYDENGLPVPELDGSVHNFSILGGDEEDAASLSEDERNEAHSAIHVEPEFITDFRPEERNTVCGEYSYANFLDSVHEQFQTQLLAGPSHWKFKHIRPTASKFSGVIEQQQQPRLKQQKKKKKDEPSLIDPLSCSLFEENLKYKPRKNPIKYDPERVTQRPILFEAKFLSKDIPFLSKPQFLKINYIDPPKDGVEDEVQPYNYQNPLDSEYCSQPALQMVDDDAACDNNDGLPDGDSFQEEELGPERCANAEPQKLADVEQLLGDNLVEAPQMVKKNFISYALQPKKLNIKKLKNIVWRCLVTDENTSNNKDMSEEQLKALPVRPTRFCNIYRRLPNLMSSSMKKELSCPTVFVSLLHLTNEHHLKIIKDPNNMFDFEISK